MGADIGIYVFLILAGLCVGFLSGLLGLGGGIIMFPVLLYLPSALGLGEFDISSITGLTMAQGFFSATSAMYFYHQQRLVNKALVWTLGVSLFISSMAGALFSHDLQREPLMVVFGVLALAAALLMLLPRAYHRDEETEEGVSFNKPLAVGMGLVLGFFLGMIGQGGAFIIIPVLLYVLRIPLRVALGSTLAIALLSSSAGFAGKALTGQVPLLPAIAILVSTVPAARLGGVVGKRTEVRYLKWLLALVISASALKVWYDILGR